MAENKKRILVIDDEDDIRLFVGTRLQRAGYETLEASDGFEGLRSFYSGRPDLVVLDIAMPVMDGWQVLERIREVSSVPVLMLTAAAQERDKIRGLTGGADDYVTKPFSGDEFLARVAAMLRRTTKAQEASSANIYRDPEISIDFPRHEVVVRGQQVELSPTEFRLLSVLTRNAGQVLSQDQLLDHVWGQDYAESLDVVRLYIGYLRRKIEITPSSPTPKPRWDLHGYLHKHCGFHLGFSLGRDGPRTPAFGDVDQVGL